MHPRLASLPMYLANRPAVTALWELLRQSLVDAGLQRMPEALTWPDDHHAHWLDSDLLISQTCGYPFTDDLAGKVQLLTCLCAGPAEQWRRCAALLLPCCLPQPPPPLPK